MSLLRALAVFLTVLAAGQVCFAQTNQSNDKQDTRKKYQVEVIAFHYLGPDSSGGEQFDRLSVKDYLPAPGFDIDQYNRLRETITYTRLSHLNDVLDRLQADPRFAVMLATAWIQPLLDKKEAVEVPLGSEQGSEQEGYDQGYYHGAGPGAHREDRQDNSQDNSQSTNQDGSRNIGQDEGGSMNQSVDQGMDQTGEMSYGSQADAGGAGADSRISGTLSVYGDHYLFVDLNLEAAFPESMDENNAFQSTSAIPAGDGAESGGNGPRVFHISERRRIKLDEVQYFDHPYIGAIVSVTRYEGPMPDSGGADQ